MKLEGPRWDNCYAVLPGGHGPAYLKITKHNPKPTVQEQGPSWDKMWTEVDKDGKTLGRRILETFWAEDR